MQIKHRTAIFFSGSLWLVIGSMLMMKGMRLLMGISTIKPPATEAFPLINFLMPLAGYAEQAVLCLVGVSLIIGTLKGRTILSRAARKMIVRIQQLPNPLPLHQIYPARYYILLACMMSLGVIRRISGIADDIGGVVDVAIGCALVQGALVFYRSMSAKVTCDTVSDGKL